MEYRSLVGIQDSPWLSVLMVKIQWLTSTKEKEEKIFECFDLTPTLSPLRRFTLSENCLRTRDYRELQV
jgi:hypothetical protein